MTNRTVPTLNSDTDTLACTDTDGASWRHSLINRWISVHPHTEQ